MVWRELYLLFNTTLCAEPEDLHFLLLTDTMGAVHSLQHTHTCTNLLVHIPDDWCGHEAADTAVIACASVCLGGPD